MMTQNNGRRLSSAILRNSTEYYGAMEDQETAAFLQRIEERIYSYGGDVLDGWLGMAEQFSQAKTNAVTTSWEWSLSAAMSLNSAAIVAQRASASTFLMVTSYPSKAGASAVIAGLSARHSRREGGETD